MELQYERRHALDSRYKNTDDIGLRQEKRVTQNMHTTSVNQMVGSVHNKSKLYILWSIKSTFTNLTGCRVSNYVAFLILQDYCIYFVYVLTWNITTHHNYNCFIQYVPLMQM